MHFDAPGHLEVALLERLGVGRDADFYLCGPSAFLQDFTEGLANWGVARDRVVTEIFGPGKSSAPGQLQVSQSLSASAGGIARGGTARVFCPERASGFLGSGAEESA